MQAIIDFFQNPEVGLSSVFIFTFISATIVPIGSEPVVMAYVKLVPDSFWAGLIVATLGNTLGACTTYAMGRFAKNAEEKLKKKHHPRIQRWIDKSEGWLNRLGPPVLFIAWLPFIGDFLCLLAGWRRMPFWICTFYMGFGRFVRYVVLLVVMLWIYPNGI